MSERALRNVLWADVIGSGISVVLTIVGAVLIGGWLDVSAWIPFLVGILLIPWVLLLVRTVRRDQLRPVEVGMIVGGNLAWVVAAAILIFGFPGALSTGGKWIVGIFSVAVLDYGVAEWIGLRSLARRGEAAAV